MKVTFRLRAQRALYKKIFGSACLIAGGLALATLAVPATAAPERPSAPGDPMPTRVLDPESGLATFATPDIDLQGPPYLFRVVARFSYLDAVPHRPDTVRFSIIRTGAREKWQAGEQITLRTPNQRMFWDSTVNGTDTGGVAMESAAADIDTNFFMALMKEDSVLVEIGKMKGVLDKAWLRPMKELVKKIPG